MKRLVVLLFLALIFIFSPKIYADDGFYFVWENTTVEVEVGDAIDNYLLIPKARLYYSNGRVKDSSPGMLWGEDETDPDFINTTKLGTYKLTYRAVSDIEEATTVIFKVVDTKPPVIEQIADIVVGTKDKADYKGFFNITDNYDSLAEMNVRYDDLLVNYNVPGTYRLAVSVTDSSSNYASGEYSVTVKAVSKPDIKAIDNSFKISYGDTFMPSRYYSAHDSFGYDITSRIVFSNIDTKKLDGTITSKILSTQAVDFSVSDDYGNTTSWSQIFYIVDESIPSIELVKDRIEINVGMVDEIDKSYFLDQIFMIEDNSGVSSIDIEYNSIRKAVGEYSVIYHIRDKASNEATKVLLVSVVCDSSPVIKVKSDIKIKVSSNVNYYRYISVYDKYDGDITMNAEIDDSSVNYNKEGVYFAYITSRNSYGKTSYQTIMVHVEKGFWASYYYLFLIPVAVAGVVVFFVIKKKKSVL